MMWWGSYEVATGTTRRWRLGPTSLWFQPRARMAGRPRDDRRSPGAHPRNPRGVRVANLTHFPIRRVDIPLGVAYDSDFVAVRAAIQAVVDDNPKCLQEPEARTMFVGFAESAADLQVSVWASQENWFEIRRSSPTRSSTRSRARAS